MAVRPSQDLTFSPLAHERQRRRRVEHRPARRRTSLGTGRAGRLRQPTGRPARQRRDQASSNAGRHVADAGRGRARWPTPPPGGSAGRWESATVSFGISQGAVLAAGDLRSGGQRRVRLFGWRRLAAGKPAGVRPRWCGSAWRGAAVASGRGCTAACGHRVRAGRPPRRWYRGQCRRPRAASGRTGHGCCCRTASAATIAGPGQPWRTLQLCRRHTTVLASGTGQLRWTRWRSPGNGRDRVATRPGSGRRGPGRRRSTCRFSSARPASPRPDRPPHALHPGQLVVRPVRDHRGRGRRLARDRALAAGQAVQAGADAGTPDAVAVVLQRPRGAAASRSSRRSTTGRVPTSWCTWCSTCC